MSRKKELPSRGSSFEIRTAREILATLDEEGAVEGIPFMPEMIRARRPALSACRSGSRRSAGTSPESSIRARLPEHRAARGPALRRLRPRRLPGASAGSTGRTPGCERVDATPEHRSDDESLEELRASVTADADREAVRRPGRRRCSGARSPRRSVPRHRSRRASRGQYVARAPERERRASAAVRPRRRRRMIVWRIAHRSAGTRHAEGRRANRVDGEKLGLEAG